MKKYISLILCLVFLAGALMLNYEPKLAGKGSGKNTTVANYEEFSSVLDSITTIADFGNIFNGNGSSSGTEQTPDEENKAKHNSVTLSTTYRTTSAIDVSGTEMEVSVDGDETWYITNGGDRFYIELSAGIGINAAELGGASNIIMECCLYYDVSRGFFIKYDKFTMPGASLPAQMMNRWISVSSFSSIMGDADEIFGQTLMNNYNWLSSLDSHLNEYREGSFTLEKKSVLKMKNDIFREFSLKSLSSSSDILDLDVSISDDDIKNLDGALRVDLSDKDAPEIKNDLDISYSVKIDGQTANYVTKSTQKMTITNIDNTVIDDIDDSKIYDLEDLMEGM